MENKYKYIEELTELFFEGATSNSQENELYVFFKNAKDLPEHLVPYKRMFGYFENGITPENEKTTGAGPIHIRPRRTALRKTAAAAAVLLLLAAIPLYLFNHQEKPDPYKGSYIRRRKNIRPGHRSRRVGRHPARSCPQGNGAGRNDPPARYKNSRIFRRTGDRIGNHNVRNTEKH